MVKESTGFASALSIAAVVFAQTGAHAAAASVGASATVSATSAPPSAPPSSVPVPPPPPSPPSVTSEPPGPPPGPPEHVPPPPPGHGPSDVQYEPDDPSVTLLMQNGVVPVGYGYRWHGWYRHGWYYGSGFAPSYSPICTGPCTARFTPGAYDFALEHRGHIVPAPGPTMITGPSVIRASYIDRSGTRIAGVIIGIGGVIAGTIMIFASVDRTDVCDVNGFCYEDHTVDGPLLAGGIGVLIGSAIVGSVLAWQHDEASVQVLPLRLSSLRLGGREGGFSQSLPEGAALRVRF